jgi:hypothetical protein
MAQVIYLHPSSPAKPAVGQACNGCGVCCAAAPCPLGIVFTRRWRGRCSALEWNVTDQRHVCGALARPRHWLPWLPARWSAWAVRRWIAAGKGCDSSLIVG